MDFLRTPDSQFLELPDFDFQPRFLDVGGLRMAFVFAAMMLLMVLVLTPMLARTERRAVAGG